MKSKKRNPIAVNGLFGQFITYLLEPKKKHKLIEKKPKRSKTWGSGQGKRECTRRIRQGLAGLNCR